MSLICWLPLNQDLHNQGISNLIKANVTAATVLENNGKIGKCYTNTGTTASVATPLTLNTIAFSACAWVRINTSRTSWCRAFGMSGTNTYFGLGCEHSNGTLLGFHFYKTIDGTNTGIFDNYPTSKKVGTWVHYVMAYDGEKAYLYENGILLNTLTIAAARQNTRCEMTNLYLFGGTSGNYSQCSLNDVRIYDHCLSAAEVKEIAQGLVLHYKLDASSEEKMTIIPSTNAYSYPTFNTSTASGGWNHWGPSGHSGSYGQNTDKKYIYNKNNTYSHWITEDAGTGKYYLLYQNPAFEGGYRSLQAIIKEENDLPITESICYPNWNARNGGVPNNKWTTIKSLGDGFYYCCCEGVSQDGSNDLIGIIVHPGYKIYVSECYLENNTETCSPIFTCSSNIVQDSSGYNHNGTILNDVIISSDSPRYNNSINLTAGNSAINCGRGGMVTDSITVNMWLKSSAWGNPVSCTEGGGWNFESSGDGFRFPVYLAGVGYKATGVTTTTRAQLCNNQWHMITGVYDRLNQKIRVYIDANLEYEENTSSSALIGYHSSNVIWIGAEASGSATTIGSNGMAGLFSDFRIYCTPLLDTDVKQLYNVGMKVDKQQNIHAFDANEQLFNIMYKPNFAIGAQVWQDGLNRYTQSNCQVNLTNDGVYVYRPANLNQTDNGNTMYGGLKIINSTIDNIHVYDSTIDNIFNLQKGHTYIWVFHVKGNTTNAPSFQINNNMGWGGGGLSPTPSNVTIKNISSNFNGETEVWYKFTINDDIVKTCTSAYSSFVANNQYLSYKHFGWNWSYATTGNGTNIYITNIRLYDITNMPTGKLTKSGIIKFSSIFEINNTIHLTKNEDLILNQFIER